jgi:acylphosphatase
MRESSERFIVEGRVQGVGFRAWTRHKAARLGLRGWVRNLPDGRVEVAAAGPPEKVEELRSLLARGPGMSRVDAVRLEGHPDGIQADDTFAVRY